ncbi:hypothetical protein [Phaeodactylibacter luteus]|uniref:Tetratricopeptide repeat protein n=1 Tax=Phaeodactylibacter luteus TaxID=1564516 RepID=A0A5C6RN20_9BACT|nr:hypothetical protein [Phaeodactylibacter luteus]TXB63607.1 hypothetical protein FRY97_08775 [Phaeodactylibacter luteus]
MKTMIFLAMNLLLAWATYGQDGQFENGMAKGLALLEEAERTRDFGPAAALFERISEAEPQRWQPAYHLAYCHMMLAGEAMEEKEGGALSAHLDKAQAALDRALALAPQESEIVALQGYVYTGRIWKAPMVNGAKYSPKASAAYAKAIELNDENPRAYHLMGMHLFYTPSFFGGGAEAALPYLEKAAARFDAGKKTGEYGPVWGAFFNQELLQQAKQATE